MSETSGPITTDSSGLKKLLGQKQPALLILFDGSKLNKPLEDAIEREARRNRDELLVIRVDGTRNPDVMQKYRNPALPALVTLTPAFFGRKTKSSAENIRPADVRNHIAHLLEDKALPQEKESPADSKKRGGQKPLVVSDQNFQREVLKSKTPVLVDFWAPWCGPCHTIAPYIEDVASKYAGRIKVAKLNTETNRRIASQFGIQSIPTFIMFEGGQPVGRFTGASPSGVQRLIEDALVPE